MSRSFNCAKLSRFLVLMSLCTVTLCVNLDSPKPFGTKTIYDWSFSAPEFTERSRTSLPVPDSCRPLYVGAFLRHGTRNPSDGDVEEAQQLMDRIRGHITAPAYSYLNDWVYPFTVKDESQLVEKGHEEHVGIGRRYASRTQSLLGGAQAAEIKIVASTRSRTQDSAKGFRQGLSEILGKFGDKAITINNSLARYYDECDKYVQEVDDNPETKAEERKYLKGEEMLGLARTLSQRLGLDVSDLTSEEVYTIFQSTGQEEGILGASDWMGLWSSKDELNIVDYVEDFDSYWERGYGNAITYEMSCVVLKEFFSQMDAAKAAEKEGGSSHPKGTFMFGHSGSVVPLMCLLGLFKDSTLPILATNYATQGARTFWTSRFAPMATNVAFVLYECQPGSYSDQAPSGVSWPPSLDRFMVQLLHKEIPIEIPNTCGYDLCPYDNVRRHFEEYVDRCNFNRRCSVDTSSAVRCSSSLPGVVLLIATAIAVLNSSS